MAVITFPDDMKIGKFAWGPLRRDVNFDSVFGSQAVGVSAPKWRASIAQSVLKDAGIGAWQALALDLEGGVNQLALWNVMRPAPLGTMRGTMTLSANAAQGAISMQIDAAGEVAKTLLKGDLLGLGSGMTQQVVVLTADAQSDGTGRITVSFKHPLRNAFALGAAVAWDKPKALFRNISGTSPWEYGQGKVVSGIALDLVEDWRA